MSTSHQYIVIHDLWSSNDENRKFIFKNQLILTKFIESVLKYACNLAWLKIINTCVWMDIILINKKIKEKEYKIFLNMNRYILHILNHKV